MMGDSELLSQFHALLVSGHPFLIPSIGLGSGVAPGGPPVGPWHQNKPSGFQVALWTRQVQHCMACHQLWQFRGSTLALAIITLELEALTPDWFSVCTDLMKKAQVDSAEFIHCRETVDDYLHSLEFSLSTNTVYILEGGQIQAERVWSVRQSRRQRGQRDQGEADEYYDGFRCLYSEEAMPEPGAGGALFDLPQKNVSPCPPLHPAVN